jgi:uncharacterized protein involved in outer membrane biogenesis
LPDWLAGGVTAKGLDGDVSLQARGYSLGSWLASLDASLGFTLAQGALSGIDLAAIPKPGLDDALAPTRKSALFAGQTPFDAIRATASIGQGDLQLDNFQLNGAAGEMTAAGQVDLVQGVCNINLALKPPGGSTALSAVLQGPLRHPTAWIVHGTAMN